jgi:diaminopimelate decarboxylase
VSFHTACHFRSISCASYSVIVVLEKQKSLSNERPWEADAAFAAVPPASGKKQRHCHQCNHGFPMEPAVRTPLLQLFPDTATVADGGLVLGGVRASDLAREFGTPVVVYDEATLRAQAAAYRDAAPGALIAYGTKAFPSVAVLRLFAEEGLGADVSTVGELAFARRAGIAGKRLVVHGNNKEDELLRGAADADALVVLDSVEEIDRARRAGATRFLVRVTPGIEADTHEAVKTAHHGSKFGLPPDDAVEALRRVPEAEGLHVHVGSQLMHFGASLMTVDWVAGFAARLRAELGWVPRVVDLGGGLGVRHVLEEPSFSVGEFVGGLTGELRRSFHLQQLPEPSLILEPGRSLVSRAGVTLYAVGGVKRASAATTYVTVDGGMSDNPRPAMYNARYAALVATRADEEPTGAFAVAGKHCESGDLLIERVELPEPRRGDLLAVPVTGAYTLAMSSTYNAVPRPPAVLVADGEARLIRRRETVDDLLALEA